MILTLLLLKTGATRTSVITVVKYPPLSRVFLYGLNPLYYLRNVSPLYRCD